jgi:hypothetical protein
MIVVVLLVLYYLVICLAMSLFTGNAHGMFWYGIGIIVTSMTFKVLFEKL